MDGILLQQVVNGLAPGLVYGLVAIGHIMVHGVIGVINFAHGEVYMTSIYLSTIALALLASFGLWNFPLLVLDTLLFTVLVTCIYGQVIERTAYKPLHSFTRLASLISVIDTSLILQNYVQVVQEPCQQGIPTLLDDALKFHVDDGFIQLIYTKLPIPIASLVGMTMLIYVIRYAKLGRMHRVAQQGRKMAPILGINIDRVISYMFVVGAAIAALAGVLITMNYSTFDFCAGSIIDIKALTVAVPGGIGSLSGVMPDDLVLGIARAQFPRTVNTDYKDVFAFSLLVLILIFRPQGPLGRPQVAKV